MLVFTPESTLDRDLFEIGCLYAAECPAPSYIGDIAYDPGNCYERWLLEGDMRTAANRRIGTAHARSEAHQRIPNTALTVDQIGRLAEGPIELMLGLDVAAVLPDSTDARPDKTLGGVRLDVKGAAPRPGNSFAVPCWRVARGEYDALLLVQCVEPGLVRVWGCACRPGDGWQEYPASQVGKRPFYRIACPEPPTMH